MKENGEMKVDRYFDIPVDLKYPKHLESYFREILEKVEKAYKVAEEARKKGLDPVLKPEIDIVNDMASRVEAMVGPPGISKRIRELLREGKEVEEIAFIVAKEIAEGKYGFENLEERATIALKAATAILTQGVVAAPLEGIVKVVIRRSGHLAVYYAGPIRSAGGTEVALTVLLADVIRKTLGLKPYKASQLEIERMVEEVLLYSRHANLQYPVSREKIIFAIERIPIEITGEATLDVEVSGPYQKIPNIETPKVRGGAVLVINDGLIAKAKKLIKYVKKFNLTDWEWLEELVELDKKLKEQSNDEQEENKRSKNESLGKKIVPDFKYLSEVIIGRPVFASPSACGGFRLVYGRSRNTGLAAVGVHPVTMYLLGSFIAVGTQIKPERPGKGAIVMPVTSILPPLVRLKNGSLKFIRTLKEAKKVENNIDKILFLGDMLVAIGEFLENNHTILPSPIVEDWWEQELEEAIKKKGYNTEEYDISDIIKKAENDPLFAIELSKKLGIPLHPKWTYFWRNISGADVLTLRDYILRSNDGVLPNERKLKLILEKLFIEHEVIGQKIKLSEADFKALKELLKLIDPSKINKSMNGLEAIRTSGIDVKDKYPVFIGARMGRPEKAKMRQMKPPVHVLFPMGAAGSRSRSIVKAAQNRLKSTVEAVNKYCPKCKIKTFRNVCEKCGSRTVLRYTCPRCGYETLKPATKCPRCGAALVNYTTYEIDFLSELRRATDALGISLPKDVKGVKGLTSAKKLPEPLEKGILRAKYNLFVFKDGTIRLDATDAPLTHFRPREIGVSVEKLRELGYRYDIYGNELKSEDQILELKPQDIIINEEIAEALVRVTQFIDELLVRFYKMKPFYNVKKKEDLIGHLVIGLAPHTSAGIIGRIIGFTKAKCTFAHPYWHAAKRRNCDGDEDSVILLLDALLNFSREYLPKQRGGMMDAPLVVTTILNPLEVDTEVYNMDICWRIPLEFYRKSQEYPEPDEIEELIENVEKRIGKPEQFYGFGFTYDTDDIAGGPTLTAYKSLGSMQEKLQKQYDVMSKIAAVDLRFVTDKIVAAHILPDILGNLRSYGTQKFRCSKCNAKFRRMPLYRKCPYCGGRIIKTVHVRTVLKYAPIAKQLLKQYGAYDFNTMRFKIFELTDWIILSGQSLSDIMDTAEELSKITKEEKKVTTTKVRIDLTDFF